MSLIANTEVMSWIQIKPHTFVEIDHEIFSKVFRYISLAQEKFGHVNYYLNMTIAVNWDVKRQIKQKTFANSLEPDL